jgi:hypothetical protein
VENFAVLFSASNLMQTITPGATMTFDFLVSPPTGTTFPADIEFSISGLPAGATYNFSPSTLKAGSDATSVKLTITLPISTAVARPLPGHGCNSWPLALGLLLLPFAGHLRRASTRFHRAMIVLLLMGAGLAVVTGLASCRANSGFFAQQQQTYTVTVTATSGTLSHSAALTLTVE